MALRRQLTGISSEIRTKLRDWAVWQARADCYSQAALSSNHSKTLYIIDPQFHFKPDFKFSFLSSDFPFSVLEEEVVPGGLLHGVVLRGQLVDPGPGRLDCHKSLIEA